jgi:hypothetical protein
MMALSREGREAWRITTDENREKLAFDRAVLACVDFETNVCSLAW